MTNPPECLPLPAKVPLPEEDGVLMLDDVRSLLQRGCDQQTALEEVCTVLSAAEDQVWGTIAERLYELHYLGVGGSEHGSNDLEKVRTVIENMFEEAGVEFVDPLGQHLSEFSPYEFETLHVRPAATAEEDGRVAETFRPLIRRHGRMLVRGQLVIFSSLDTEQV